MADQLSSVSVENIEKFLESYQYLVEKGIIANLGKQYPNHHSVT